MAALDSLPDLDIHEEYLHQPVLEVKTLEVKAETYNIPDIDPVPQPEQPAVTNYPKTILIKKQAKPLLWHTPEQDFHIVRHQINPVDTDALEAFIEQNIPKDPTVRLQALKFIEDVMWGKTSDHSSKVYYNDGKNKSFMISFLF
jgi:hypothetical protein